jgi:hypothetical protein
MQHADKRWAMPGNVNAVSMCAERLRLSDTVTKAVQANYAAKDAHERALKRKENAAPLIAALAIARKAESNAVAALNRHRQDHGC